MSKQHYLPATYIAYFSKENNPKRRERIVSVGFKSDGKIIDIKPEKICLMKNMYETSLDGFDWSVDDNWTNIERRLTRAVDDLANRTLSGLDWAFTLVPFVTSLLVRGPDFEKRLINRIPGMEHAFEKNVGRSVELQRLLPIIAVAKWTVTRFEKPISMITNELGYVILQTGLFNEPGISIPFGNSNMVLTIVPKTRRTIIKPLNNKFVPLIEYRTENGNNNTIKKFNFAINSYSQAFIFGENQSLVRKYLTIKNHNLLPLEPYQIGFPVQFGRHHELTWLKLIDFLLKVSPEENIGVEINLLNKPEGGSMIMNPIITEKPFCAFKSE